MGFSPFRPTGLTHADDRAAGGCTLVTPMAGDATYLLDEVGRIVHRWEVPDIRPGYGKLLPGGHLLVSGLPFAREGAKADGTGTMIELDGEGKEIWRWEHPGRHHDMCRMPNGNTLTLVAERVPDEIAERVRGGMTAELTDQQRHILGRTAEPMDIGLPEGMVGDALWEIAPSGETVRVWHGYEHMDPELDTICPLEPRREWMHANACTLTPDGDVLLSFRQTDQVVCISWPDGEVRWKFGRGVVSHQHNPSITPTGTLLVFDNGTHHPIMQRTRVVEVDTTTWEVVWEYRGSPEFSFSSGHISGCERLANGNTLICEGQTGRVFEVTPDGDICWEWVNPFVHERGDKKITQIFRAHRYAMGSPELDGVRIDPGEHADLNRRLGLSPR